MDKKQTTLSNKRIVVIDGGWVLIGDVIREDEYNIYMENASVIRRWGTTAGLGQIALTGPTDRTVLDPVGSVDVPRNSIRMRIKCEV